MKDFLRKKISPRPGDIVTLEGDIVGRHDGLDAYTIGQRQGIQVSKDQHAWYVAAKDIANNRLIIVPHREHPALYTKEAIIHDITWCATNPCQATQSAPVEVAIRYRQAPVKASIEPMAHPTFQAHRLTFSEPVWALAPGQSAVLYQGDECLGGGFLSLFTVS